MQQYYIPRELVKSNRTKSGSWSNYIVVLLTAGDFNHTDSKEISVKKNEEQTHKWWRRHCVWTQEHGKKYALPCDFFAYSCLQLVEQIIRFNNESGLL